MFEVTEKASEMAKKFLEAREGPKSIRVYRDEGDWKGPHLVMAFDQPKESDQIFEDKGLTFIVDKELFNDIKPLKIDYIESVLGAGFIFESEFMKDKKAICESICDIC